MKIAIQIPIKARSSTRVPNKNFRDLAGKPFSCWLLDELILNCPEEWDIYIDSEDVSAYDQFKDRYPGRLKFHQRSEWFASDAANGNHLLSQFTTSHTEYDVFVQVFVTAITLTAEIIKESVEAFISSLDQYDSMFLVTEKTGWFWFQGKPMNYDPSRPDGLPRSQDALVFEETTGLYAITCDAAMRTGCRIGQKPLMYKIPHKYAYDVDTMEDFTEAQRLLTSP
jgi:CMP-N-acetylneuraminic acid synthetase